jgi:hypothetical protein
VSLFWYRYRGKCLLCGGMLSEVIEGELVRQKFNFSQVALIDATG